MKTRVNLFLLLLACQGAHVLSTLWLIIGIIVGSGRAWRIIVAYDRVMNAATGGNDRETISSRANRGMNEGRRGWCILCRLLDWFQPGHCARSAGI